MKKNLATYAKAEIAFADIKHVLMNDIAEAWNAAPQPKRIISVFRAEFTAAAESLGYSESWAKKVLAATDFLRVRNLRSDSGQTRTPKAGKAKPVTFTLQRIEAVLSGHITSKKELKAILAELMA